MEILVEILSKAVRPGNSVSSGAAALERFPDVLVSALGAGL